MNSTPHDSTQIQNDDISGETSVRIIPGPTGVYQRAKLRKIADTREGVHEKSCCRLGFDDDFTRGPWLSAVDYTNANGWVVNGCLGDIKSHIKKGKGNLVLAIIKSCNPNALGDLTVTLKDLSGSLSGTIHHKIINEGGYGKDINVGATLILRNISVFSPKSGHYLNITMKNLFKMYNNLDALSMSSCRSCAERLWDFFSSSVFELAFSAELAYSKLLLRFLHLKSQQVYFLTSCIYQISKSLYSVIRT
ncbi:hypothetical protein CTI12_AA296480 [Artemisia annua]|uniref:Homologous recombination OB-fold protein OB-fold domain-containing protein n=1 Tax=Artemisia annua TaxID=35608 RepID=A0A2U1N7X4_ARTAN|nr:hypothetical protein CTI12_AA296480 [Artemisia annua]